MIKNKKKRKKKRKKKEEKEKRGEWDCCPTINMPSRYRPTRNLVMIGDFSEFKIWPMTVNA